MKQKEINEGKTFRDRVRPMVNEWLEDKHRGVNELDPTLYDELHDYEIKLRNVLKTSGLQQKMKESPGDAL